MTPTFQHCRPMTFFDRALSCWPIAQPSGFAPFFSLPLAPVAFFVCSSLEQRQGTGGVEQELADSWDTCLAGVTERDVYGPRSRRVPCLSVAAFETQS